MLMSPADAGGAEGSAPQLSQPPHAPPGPPAVVASRCAARPSLRKAGAADIARLRVPSMLFLSVRDPSLYRAYPQLTISSTPTRKLSSTAFMGSSTQCRRDAEGDPRSHISHRK